MTCELRSDAINAGEDIPDCDEDRLQSIIAEIALEASMIPMTNPCPACGDEPTGCQLGQCVRDRVYKFLQKCNALKTSNYITSELDRLREVVKKLERTADGAIVVPYVDEVFYPDKRGVRIMQWIGTTVCDYVDYDGVPMMYVDSNHRKTEYGTIAVSECYSTRELAVQASERMKKNDRRK